MNKSELWVFEFKRLHTGKFTTREIEMALQTLKKYQNFHQLICYYFFKERNIMKQFEVVTEFFEENNEGHVRIDF